MSAALALGGALLGVDLIDRHYTNTQDKHLPKSLPSPIFKLLEGIWTVGILVFYLSGTGEIGTIADHVKNLSLKGIIKVLLVGSAGIISGLWLEKYTESHTELTVAAFTLLVTLIIEGFIIIKGEKGTHSQLISALVIASSLSWLGVCLLIAY